MEPKPAAPATVAGAPSGGVFVTLNASARNSILNFSPKEVRFISAMSAFRYCGPRTGLRELLPIVNCGAMVKAEVLKNRAVLRSDDGRLGSLLKFGRCVPKPANALKLVTW